MEGIHVRPGLRQCLRLHSLSTRRALLAAEGSQTETACVSVFFIWSECRGWIGDLLIFRPHFERGEHATPPPTEVMIEIDVNVGLIALRTNDHSGERMMCIIWRRRTL